MLNHYTTPSMVYTYWGCELEGHWVCIGGVLGEASWGGYLMRCIGGALPWFDSRESLLYYV